MKYLKRKSQIMEAETTEQDGVAVKIWNRGRKVLSSNLGRDTTYPGRSVLWFSLVPSGKC
jgi:hypothetical protein